MVMLAEDLRLALDRVSFAWELGLEPDPWQGDLLRSSSDRVLLNCCRQSGKSTMSAVIALHRALFRPGSLILCLALALRQSQELFGKIATFYRDLERPVSPTAERKHSLARIIHKRFRKLEKERAMKVGRDAPLPDTNGPS